MIGPIDDDAAILKLRCKTTESSRLRDKLAQKSMRTYGSYCSRCLPLEIDSASASALILRRSFKEGATCYSTFDPCSALLSVIMSPKDAFALL